VENFFEAKTKLRQIDLQFLREYLQEQRKQICATMRKPVSARTVNYELRLLRGVMEFADCRKGISRIAADFRANERTYRYVRIPTLRHLLSAVYRNR
jgi:hypothetical protein